MISPSITLITAFYLLKINGILFSLFFFIIIILSANRNGRQTAAWMHKVLSLRKVTSQRKKKELLFLLFFLHLPQPLHTTNGIGK